VHEKRRWKKELKWQRMSEKLRLRRKELVDG
jgi:hypothetical protein